MIKEKIKIIIATGGTGGHVFPAFSLAKYFTEKNILTEIVIDKRGFKYIEKYSFPNVNIINSSTIFKKNPILLIWSLIKIILAFIKSFLFLIKSKPQVVFGMGGYSSFPICIASKILNIPFVIYESNLYLVKTNKFLLLYAHKLLVLYADLTGVPKKNEEKKVEVGNIVRNEILNFNIKKKNIFKNKINILILGGSQAAKSFAEKLPPIFKKCKDEKIKLELYQQCLKNQSETLNNFYEKAGINFELFNFSHNIIEYFNKVDFVITRSGASISAELLNCNIPFVSIPFPYAADNHQLKNAKYFEKKGYSFLIEEKEIDYKLFSLIKSIYKDNEFLGKIKAKQKLHSDKLVYKKIENEIKKFIND